MSSFYKTPIYGRAFLNFNPKNTIEINKDNIGEWSFRSTTRWGKEEYSVFANKNGDKICQSFRALKFVRCRPGEENHMSKISNAQGIEIFERSNEGESIKDLAKEFGLSEHHVSDIKNIRTRIGITLNHINGVKVPPKPSAAKVGKRDKSKKLSESLAKFIRSDKVNMKMSTKDLSKKYCVSERTIQRIVKNEMYKS